MKIVKSILGWIYKAVTGVISVIGCFILTSLSFSLPFDRDLILTRINSVSDSDEGKIYAGAVGLAVIIVIFFYLYMKAKSTHRDATIAFDNPDGEVSISMSAIEDFVTRVGKEFHEVKTIDPRIKARKEGVDIFLKVELWSGMNLPKMTEALQNVVKSQVQNILGIENVHSVQVMVHKIITREKDSGMPSQPDMFHEAGNVTPSAEENY